MKFILGMLLSAGAAYASGLFLPWWTMAAAVFLVAFLINGKGFPSFAYSFLGVGILWAVLTGLTNINNDGILASQMGALLGGLGGVSLVAVTAIIGALIAGFAGMSGAFLRSTFTKKKVKLAD